MHLPAVIVKLATAGTLASGGAASGFAIVHYQGTAPPHRRGRRCGANPGPARRPGRSQTPNLSVRVALLHNQRKRVLGVPVAVVMNDGQADGETSRPLCREPIAVGVGVALAQVPIRLDVIGTLHCDAVCVVTVGARRAAFPAGHKMVFCPPYLGPIRTVIVQKTKDQDVFLVACGGDAIDLDMRFRFAGTRSSSPFTSLPSGLRKRLLNGFLHRLRCSHGRPKFTYATIATAHVDAMKLRSGNMEVWAGIAVAAANIQPQPTTAQPCREALTGREALVNAVQFQTEAVPTCPARTLPFCLASLCLLTRRPARRSSTTA